MTREQVKASRTNNVRTKWESEKQQHSRTIALIIRKLKMQLQEHYGFNDTEIERST